MLRPYKGGVLVVSKVAIEIWIVAFRVYGERILFLALFFESVSFRL